jgi:hypothetical protein
MVLILAAALLGACGGSSDKGPAEAAIRAAEEAINSAKGEASRYAADQVRAAESQLAALREKFNKGDFKSVLSDAPALATKAKDSAAAAKKAQLTKTWEDMSAGLPKVVDAIKSRVDILSQSTGGSLDLGSLIGNIVSGGVGGGILMAIVGLIKNLMGK